MTQIKSFKRDENGLVEGVNYVFTEEGLIDWRKMVPLQFLYVNSDERRKPVLEKKYGKSLKDIDPIKDNVEDRDLVIMLGGLKYLLRLRGYTNVSCNVHTSGEYYASVSCHIYFIGNFETGGMQQSYSDCGSAHLQSTDGFGKAYLVEIATNRALSRAIRNYLNINIVSREELGAVGEIKKIESVSTPSNGSANSILQEKCKEKGFSFEVVKNRAISIGKELQKDGKQSEFSSEPEKWTDWDSIPPNDCYVLLGKVKGGKKS